MICASGLEQKVRLYQDQHSTSNSVVAATSVKYPIGIIMPWRKQYAHCSLDLVNYREVYCKNWSNWTIIMKVLVRGLPLWLRKWQPPWHPLSSREKNGFRGIMDAKRWGLTTKEWGVCRNNSRLIMSWQWVTGETLTVPVNLSKKLSPMWVYCDEMDERTKRSGWIVVESTDEKHHVLIKIDPRYFFGSNGSGFFLVSQRHINNWDGIHRLPLILWLLIGRCRFSSDKKKNWIWYKKILY